MHKITVSLASEDKEITYLIDANKSTYQVVTRKMKDGDVIEELVAEDGTLGDAEERQGIAMRLYYTILTGMKNDKA